jgi:hypothetical protein
VTGAWGSIGLAGRPHAAAKNTTANASGRIGGRKSKGVVTEKHPHSQFTASVT